MIGAARNSASYGDYMRPRGPNPVCLQAIQGIREGIKGLARWTVGLRPVPSPAMTLNELSKSGRGLWNKEKGGPALAVKAVEQLRACHVEIERLRKLHLRRRLQQCLLWRLREKAKQEGVH